MKIPLILRYTIRCVLFIVFGYTMQGQTTTTIDLEGKDTITYTYRYGLRIGADLSKLARSSYENNYRGFELVGDYRVSLKFYIAAEIGVEEKTTEEDQYNFTTSGTYLKGGFDYNAYNNWYGMENMIYAGLRYGFGTFNPRLNSYTLYNTNTYWGEGDIAGADSELLREYQGLTAHWIEMVLGLKAELFNNIYLGVSVRLNRLLTTTSGDNFPNLWIPGFQKVTDGSTFGVGYNYSITYFIPLYKNKKNIVR